MDMGKKLTKQRVRERIENLKKEINRHRYLYHVLDQQEISDAALDSLKKELEQLEYQFPEFVTSDSPTQRIGGKARAEFTKVRHAVPMLSFNDVFSEGDFFSWVERISKLVPEVLREGFFLELKIDGLAVSLEYNNGLFSVGSTRGDGVVGEDVTHNLKTIEAIPLGLRTSKEVAVDLAKEGFHQLAKQLRKGFPRHLEVRGEVFLGKKEFAAINREQKKHSQSLYANPRNIAAGSIRQLDPKVAASRNLDSFAYDLVTDLGQKTHEETHALLRALGFKTNTHNRFAKNPHDVVSFRNSWEKNRDGLPYEIDGIVVLINDNSAFRRLGVVGKAPRGAIAYKFELREAETVVEKINIFVGRTGVLTPVAKLRPVSIGGVTVTHATLHNFDQLKKLDIREGDTVIVGRAGDVIPQVVRVLPSLRPKAARAKATPRRCPECGSPTVRDGVFIRCQNKKCPALRREHFYYFVSKGAFDIEGLGPETVDKLIDGGFIKDAADFFTLSKDGFLQVEGFAEISANKLAAALQAKKKVPFERLIKALGILHVGDETARILAQRFKTIENLSAAGEKDLQQIPDIGPTVARSIALWFESAQNRTLLRKLQRVGVRAIAPKIQDKKQSLSGTTVIFTGELKTMTRDEAQQSAREHGATVTTVVSPKTSFVVAGKDPGEKHEKATKLGIEIIDEGEFLRRVKGR